MKCKFCNEELPEKGFFCPLCGKDQREESVQEPEIAEEEQAELAFEEEDLIAQMLDCEPEEEAESVEEVPIEAPTEVKQAKRVALFTGCIAALAVLALVLFMGIRGGWDVSSWFDWQIFRENNINYKDSYTVTDKKADRKRDTVVATMGDDVLTNGQLQIYYWNEVYDFVSNYYAYLSYFGLDYTAPLSEQQYDETKTWQQYFLELALQGWQANTALAQEAKANGYALPEEYQKELDNMLTDLEANAQQNGYESANAMVRDSFGPGCNAEDYVAYMQTYYYAYAYFAEVYESIDPTMEEIENYFTAHEASMKESGITKEDGNTVDVRHILMLIDNFVTKEEDAEQEKKSNAQTGEETTQPEGTEPTEGDTTEDESDDKKEESKYSDEEWEACLAEAQRILDLWLTNPTEEYFGQLANEHSDDQDGKVTDGGIYTGITSETNFVKPFLDWCMDENRNVGDYEIVQTEYGYHIMYFSATEPIWIAETRKAIISEEAQAVVNNASDTRPMDVDYKKIVLGEVTF